MQSARRPVPHAALMNLDIIPQAQCERQPVLAVSPMLEVLQYSLGENLTQCRRSVVDREHHSIKLAWLSKTRRDPDTNTARRLLAKLHAIMIFLFCGYFITKYVFCARRFRLQSAYTSSKRPPTSLTLYCCHRFESDLQFTVSQGVPRSLFKPCGTLGGFAVQAKSTG